MRANDTNESLDRFDLRRVSTFTFLLDFPSPTIGRESLSFYDRQARTNSCLWYLESSGIILYHLCRT
uniref:Uncharacterized protein n=1 Tax=Nelumbo nucifera TaxID=4432 RepID=A0A822Z2P1_NELNU|nr:TPA_asm: hypothetical protein HUJ06_013282 [Nelumbo nucifera]